MTITILSILGMSIVDYFIQPGYLIKSFIKIILFLIVPLVFISLEKGIFIGDYLR